MFKWYGSAMAFFVLLTLLTGCTDPNFHIGREAVKSQLKDPDSAQFRNEKIRVLWTKKGSRLKLYCAEVNARNSFGGMTGYSDAQHVIESTFKDRSQESIWKKGATFVDNGLSATHEWNCDKADTERTEENLGNAIAGPYNETPEGVKAVAEEMPVLSNELAPELR